MTSMMFESAFRAALQAEGEALKARALQHAADWGPSFPDPLQPRKTRKELARIPGPNRVKRKVAYRVRMAALPQRLDITDGTGNMMVNLCRSGTRQAQLDKAERARTSMRKDAHHPNERLRHYGLKVTLRHDGEPVITGGTARQRACYLRAVDRFMGDGDPIDDAAAKR